MLVGGLGRVGVEGRPENAELESWEDWFPGGRAQSGPGTTVQRPKIMGSSGAWSQLVRVGQRFLVPGG